MPLPDVVSGLLLSVGSEVQILSGTPESTAASLFRGLQRFFVPPSPGNFTSVNLQSATVSLQVVIGLCRRKETAALKIKAAVSNGRVKLSALRRLFFFCRRAADHFNIRLKYRYSVLSSTNTTSGRLLNRNGIILFPRPRLTTIFVFPSV